MDSRSTLSGILYVADSGNHQIVRCDPNFFGCELFAGTGVAGYYVGAGSNAAFRLPTGLAFFGDVLWVADAGNQVIRRCPDSGFNACLTIAGFPGTAGAPGDGVDELFNFPQGVAIARDALLIADTGNHAIRRFDMGTGTVTTFSALALWVNQ